MPLIPAPITAIFLPIVDQKAIKLLILCYRVEGNFFKKIGDSVM
jgi:hypothetical protein